MCLTSCDAPWATAAWQLIGAQLFSNLCMCLKSYLVVLPCPSCLGPSCPSSCDAPWAAAAARQLTGAQQRYTMSNSSMTADTSTAVYCCLYCVFKSYHGQAVEDQVVWPAAMHHEQQDREAEQRMGAWLFIEQLPSHTFWEKNAKSWVKIHPYCRPQICSIFKAAPLFRAKFETFLKAGPMFRTNLNQVKVAPIFSAKFKAF